MKLGYTVASVSYDPVSVLSQFSRRRHINFPMLSDGKSVVIKAFGILNKKYGPGSSGYGLPHPVIFVLDHKGVIAHRFSEAHYTDRPEIDTVLQALK